MAKGVSTDTIIIAIAVLWSILLPSYPDRLFVLLDGIIGVFLMLFVVLLALPCGPIPGVLVLVAVALTFVERNRRKISKKIINSDVTYEQQMAPSPPMSPDEVHPPFDTPSHEETPYYSMGDSSDGFEGMGSSLDEKHVIPTLTPDNDASERLYVDTHLGSTELKEIPRVF
jgi:hypothetical protein